MLKLLNQPTFVSAASWFVSRECRETLDSLPAASSEAICYSWSKGSNSVPTCNPVTAWNGRKKDNWKSFSCELFANSNVRFKIRSNFIFLADYVTTLHNILVVNIIPTIRLSWTQASILLWRIKNHLEGVSLQKSSLSLSVWSQIWPRGRFCCKARRDPRQSKPGERGDILLAGYI